MASTLFPPGASAGLQYAVVESHLSGLERGLPSVYAILVGLVVRGLGWSVFDAMKIVASVSFALLPLAGFLLARWVSGSKLVRLFSAWLLALFPALAPYVWLGNYDLLLGILMYTFALALAFLLVRTRKLSHLLSFAVLASLTGLAFASTSVIGALYRTQVLDPFLVVTFFVAALGVYALRKKSVDKTVILVALTVVPIALAVVGGPQWSWLILISTPTLVVLASSPLVWFRDAYTLTKQQGNASDGALYELTLEIRKSSAILLVFLLAFSSLGVGFAYSTSALSENRLPEIYDNGDMLSGLNWIRDQTSRDAVIASPSVLASWIEGYSGRASLGLDQLAYDALASTNFRILNEYIRVDEWEPYATLRSPSVALFNGYDYDSLFQIDDSYVRTSLVKDGREWIESPYRSVYLGHQWVDGAAETITLKQSFKTPGLLIDKTLNVWKDRALLEISYFIAPREGVSLNKLVVPFWVEGERSIVIVSQEGGIVELELGKETVIMEVLSEFASIAQVLSEGDQEGLIVEFRPFNNQLKAHLRFEVKTAKNSGAEFWYGSGAELADRYGITHLLSNSVNAEYLSKALSRPHESLILNDAFSWIVFEYAGSTWIEAPSRGTVVKEEVVNDGNSVRSLVRYQTVGLLIDKSTTMKDYSAEITYSFSINKAPSRLVKMELSLWIPWGVSLEGFSVTNGIVRLALDNDNLALSLNGQVLSLEVSPHPEFGQWRVYVVFGLSGNSDQVGMRIESDRRLTLHHELTSRPVMDDADRIIISVDYGLFSQQFGSGEVRVFRIWS